MNFQTALGMRFILLDDSLLDAVNYKDIIIKIYVHEALFPFKPSTILIHMLILILLPQLQQPLKQLHPIRLQLPGIH